MAELIGIGTNITEVLRIARLIERHGEMFVNRVFTPEEVRYCHSRKHATQHYTATWAAKEAVLRALGAGWRRGLSRRDIEIRHEQGKPLVAVRGGIKDAIEQLGIADIQITTSHCRTHATATAVALGSPPKKEP